ncbi:MAG: DUF456 family protein [Syntrophomonadaceae bacterium]|nr:DUF456 family protein [Syntrophomonadaceae bacterium]
MDALALGLAILLFIIGMAGIFLPALPGVILIYAGMLLYGFLTGFARLDVLFFVWQGLAVGVTFLVDYLAVVIGAKRFGGSRAATWGAVLGTLFGIMLLGPFGAILGPFLGAVLGEILRGTSPELAVRVGFGTLIGFLGGSLIKLGIAVVMIIHFFMTVATGI